VSDLATLESYVSAAMAPTRFMLALIGVFAAVALVLASLGLYGVISYSVRQRTREFGVRVAFGAGARDMLRLVLAHGMVVAGIGIGLGLLASLALTRIMSSVLVGTSPTDIVTFTGVPGILVAVAVVATYIPARRATLIDPVRALRDE
jgi:ABC-type antimicrobial peptide transport system permease subunit